LLLAMYSVNPNKSIWAYRAGTRLQTPSLLDMTFSGCICKM